LSQRQTRKLVKWGSSNTLVMSLPREWTKKNKLTSNDEVQVVENPDGTLLVIPSTEAVPEQASTATIDIRRYSNIEHLKYVIETKYLSGFDIINIASKQPFTSEEYSYISKIKDQLLGFEITSKTTNQVTLQDVMSIQQTNVIPMIRVLSRNVLELIEELINAFRKNDLKFIEAMLDTVFQARTNINKYYLRIVRQLRKGLQQSFLLVQMGVTVQDIIDMVTYVTALNDVAGNIEAMSRAMQRYSQPENEQLKDVAEMLQKIHELLRQATDAFLFKMERDAIEVLTVMPKVIVEKRELENNLNMQVSTPGGILIQIVLDAGEKILEATKNIAQAALRRALSSEQRKSQQKA